MQQCVAAVSRLLNKLIVSIALWSARILHVVLHVYTVAHKKHATLFLTKTLAFLERMLTLFVLVEAGMNTLHCGY